MALRITKAIRNDIVWRVIDAKFTPRQRAMNEVEYDLANEARRHVHGLMTLETIDAISRDWFEINSYMDFNCFGPKIRLQFREAVRQQRRYNYQAYPIKDRDLSDRIMAHENARSDLHKEREKAEKALHTMLMSMATLKRLHEMWPEGHEFYKHLKDTTPPKLPTVQVSDVNAMLGIA